MSVTSGRVIQVWFSGDIESGIVQSALDNNASPGEIDIVKLNPGANTITAPSVTNLIPTALTIIPPAANTSLLTLKGVSGDTGIPLHLTDPTSIALDVTFTSLVLLAATTTSGVRLIWS
jgi:hypothetical protein